MVSADDQRGEARALDRAREVADFYEDEVIRPGRTADAGSSPLSAFLGVIRAVHLIAMYLPIFVLAN